MRQKYRPLLKGPCIGQFWRDCLIKIFIIFEFFEFFDFSDFSVNGPPFGLEVVCGVGSSGV